MSDDKYKKYYEFALDSYYPTYKFLIESNIKIINLLIDIEEEKEKRYIINRALRIIRSKEMQKFIENN
jgi:hypothetical protein